MIFRQFLNSIFLVLFFHFFELGTVQSLNLTLQYAKSRLPNVLSNAALYYDGNDSIYLFGGTYGNGPAGKEILRYSIANESVSLVGLMQHNAYTGSVHSDAEGNLYYIGAPTTNGFSDVVYQFDPVTFETKQAQRLPFQLHFGAKIQSENSSQVFMIGAYRPYDKIAILDLPSFNLTEIGTVPVEFDYTVTSQKAGNYVFFFGRPIIGSSAAAQVIVDHKTKPLKQIIHKSAMKLDLSSLTSEFGPADLPNFSERSSSVIDARGDHVYIIGGYRHLAGYPTDSIIKFNTNTSISTMVHVENFLVHTDSYFYVPPSAVFVPKLNRIYLFGGESYNITTTTHVFHNEITFLDLN